MCVCVCLIFHVCQPASLLLRLFWLTSNKQLIVQFDFKLRLFCLVDSKITQQRTLMTNTSIRTIRASPSQRQPRAPGRITVTL